MIDLATHAAILSVTRWLSSLESRDVPFEEGLDTTCKRIVDAGFSLYRLRILLLTQHPELLGFRFDWTAGKGVEVLPFNHEIVDSDAFRGSPIAVAQRERARVRVRFDRPEELARFPQLGQFADEGVTEYIAEPMFLGGGKVSCMSVATRRPGGFGEGDLALLDSAFPIVGLRLEVRALQYALQSLLSIYLGPNAAGRVLRGNFRRGTGETMRAAIWYCDMRDFTALSDRLPAREVVANLDQFFEAISGAIEAHQGEILKFIGDAALAVFPVGDDQPGRACEQALSAAEEALAAIARLNAARAGSSLPPLSMGVALHLGEVMYGNIGGRHRLDFTVIGASVNEAARLESLCKDLRVPLVMSGSFAAAVDPRRTVSLGVHTLRGVSAPQEIHSLRVAAID